MIHKAFFFILTVLILLTTAVFCLVNSLDEATMESIDAHYKRGMELYGKSDWKGSALEFAAIVEKNEGDDIAIYMMAHLLSKMNDATGSMQWLRRLHQSGSCLSPMVGSFPAINTTPEFRDLSEKLSHRASTMQHSEVATVVPEKDLTPEGIAYDPSSNTIFLSSLHRRKIVSVKLPRQGGQPVIKDFITEARDGFFCGLGMKVDARKRHLWVASSAENIMHGYRKEDEGKSAIFIYDLNSARLLQKFAIGPDPPHLLNDLVLSSDGTAYITDTVSGEIFRVTLTSKTLEPLVPAGKFSAPNGIALSDDGKKLYVADSGSGVSIVNPVTGNVRKLPQNPGIAPVLIDGLYFYKGSLIGMENVISGGRVARFYLNANNDAIVRADVVDCNNSYFQYPTTGALGDGWFYYIANSQYGSFNRDGSIFPVDQLRDVVILKSKLD